VHAQQRPQRLPGPGPVRRLHLWGQPEPEQWLKTLNACKDLQPPGTLSADRTPEQQSASLKFVQCIRDHGVRDFPDPVNGEPLVDTTTIPSTDTEDGTRILNAAMDACRDLGDAAIESQP